MINRAINVICLKTLTIFLLLSSCNFINAAQPNHSDWEPLQTWVPLQTSGPLIMSYNTGRLYKYSKWDKKEKIIIDIRKKAFAAYDANGDLVRWGPISAGKDCNHRPYNCMTPRGKYRVFRKGDTTCESTVYPEPHGGAPMPYCMFFNKDIALHAGQMPGHHASHGCVRLLLEDAKWLNEEFVEPGTRVIVQ